MLQASTTREAPGLQIEGLAKNIGETEILKNISLTVGPGEIFGIVGPDGAGKSSLLKILAGVWRPSEGHLSVDGKKFSQVTEDLRGTLGYMAFEEGLFEDLSAMENLRYTASLYQFSASDLEERIGWLLKKTRLLEFRDMAVKNFSGGMKQKLGLCCALLHRPRILLLDEPTTGMDPVSRREFWNLLADLPGEGITTLLSTPYLEEIARCHRVAFLFQGKILFQGIPKELFTQSGWKAFDLWPEKLSPAIDFLEKLEPPPDYRVRGHAIHLLYSQGESGEVSWMEKLKRSGIRLSQYQPSRVEVEDLFYLRLKSIVSPLEAARAEVDDFPLASGSRTDPVLRAENLKKIFGKIAAVQGASFEVRPGEILGIIGANGAGKTTLLRMLCGLLKPDEGKAFLFGQDPNGHREEVLDKISYMSQEFSLYEDLTVLENIQFYGGIFSLSKEVRDARAEGILHSTGLGAQRQLPVRQLPTGLRQRLALGCTMVHDPTLIFLDEPTSGTDPVTRRHLWQWITLLAEKGRSVVVTTHYMSEAEQCHQVMLMHEGATLALGSPEKICRAESQAWALFEVECEPLRPAIQVLQGLSWVHSVVPYGSHLHILTRKEAGVLKDLPTLFSQRGIQLQYLSPVPYSMEDVFVEEIGRMG